MWLNGVKQFPQLRDIGDEADAYLYGDATGSTFVPEAASAYGNEADAYMFGPQALSVTNAAGNPLVTVNGQRQTQTFSPAEIAQARAIAAQSQTQAGLFGLSQKQLLIAAALIAVVIYALTKKKR